MSLISGQFILLAAVLVFAGTLSAAPRTSTKKPTHSANMKPQALTQSKLKAAANPLSGVSLPPEVLGQWLDESDLIKEEPPWFDTHQVPPGAAVRECLEGSEQNDLRELKRSCTNPHQVLGPERRLVKTGTPENRIAILRYFLIKYGLPFSYDPMSIGVEWLKRRHTQEKPGADLINALMGMIRWNLFLDRRGTAMDLARFTDDAKKNKLPASTVYAASASTKLMLFGIDRQRRLLDFWFPDAPLWTMTLLEACEAPTGKTPEGRKACCFMKLDGCR